MRRSFFKYFALIGATGLVLVSALFLFGKLLRLGFNDNDLLVEQSAQMAAPQPASPPPIEYRSQPVESAEATITCEAGGGASPHSVQSFFPWPPPRGSDEQDFTKLVMTAVRKGAKGPVRLGNVDLFLRNRLQRVGLTSFTYFSTPHRDGYAAITRLEQIDETGTPLKGSARFTKDAAESANLLI